MTQTSFAVVVPAHNRSHFIEETIESLLNQTSPPDEIIVVDDGSTDDTFAILKRFGTQIIAAHQDNQGVQAARNHCVTLAQSDWLVFLDDDDLLQPQHLSRLRQIVSGSPQVQSIYSNFRTFGEAGLAAVSKFDTAPAGYWDGMQRDDARGWSTLDQFPLEKLCIFQPCFQSGLAVKRSHFWAAGGYDTRLRGWKAEDFEFTVRILSGAPMALNWEDSVLVRKHGSNDSGNGPKMVLGELDVYEFIHKNHALEPQVREAFAQLILRQQFAAIDAAFVLRDWTRLRQLDATLQDRSKSAKQFIKLLIARLPKPIAQPVAGLLMRG
jgi:hypothetical protein